MNHFQEGDMVASRRGIRSKAQLIKELLAFADLRSRGQLPVVAEQIGATAVDARDKRARFLKAMEAFRLPLPENYRFDRDEANER
jgi:antitoxin MazE